jgi:hypothetical protein
MRRFNQEQNFNKIKNKIYLVALLALVSLATSEVMNSEL